MRKPIPTRSSLKLVLFFSLVLASLVVALWLLVKLAAVSAPDQDPPSIPEGFTNPEPKEVGRALTPVMTYRIDASSIDRWVYFRFSNGTIVEIRDKRAGGWDIAFRKAKMIVHDGIAAIPGVEFDSVTEAPESGYRTESRDNASEPEETAAGKWYRYNYLTHRLTPEKNVHVIRTAEGKFAKLKILGYYCGDSAGCYTFQYVYQGNGSRSFVPHRGRSR